MNSEKFDYVITGSGVAGAALAWKILRADPKACILILEAGKKLKMRDFSIFQDYLVTGREPYQDYWDKDYDQRDREGENQSLGQTVIPMLGSRLMMYGGSTVHWGGWSFRLKPEDFRLATNTGEGIDWPFDYDHLEPYYGEAEHYIGVSGDSQDSVVSRSRDYPFKAFPYTLEDAPAIGAFEKLDISYSHLPIARQGFSHSISSHAPCQTTGKCKYCPFGARYVAANYLDDLEILEEHPNFSIRTEVVVDEIIMSSRGRARGVQCHNRKTGQSVLFEAEYVIVASGGIESPKLLQRSTSNFWPKGIGNDHNLVGANFITHPYFIFQAALSENPHLLQPEMGFPTLVSRHYDSPVQQKDGKFILINPPDSPKFILPGTRPTDLAGLMRAGHDRETIDAAIRGPVIIELHGIVETFSRGFNRVSNGTRINRVGLLETVIQYRMDDAFTARLQAIQGYVEKIFSAMNATRSQLLNLSWRADHAACTTRMSADPALGVVDPDLKVHGTDNIYVCSNASFASLGSVNPTLTLTGLALRLADHLIGLRQGVARSYQPAPGELALASA